MENETNTDDLLFRVHYSVLNSYPSYPEKQLWQLTKENLDFLNSITNLDEITKIKIQIITYEILEKIVTPNLDQYVNGSIDVPMEEIYGEESHILKKIYESDFEKQKLLDDEKIIFLINRILYLPAILLSNIKEEDLEVIKEETKKEVVNITDLIRWTYKSHKNEIDKEFEIIENAKEKSSDKMFPNLWKKAEIFQNWIYKDYSKSLNHYEMELVRDYMKPSKFRKLVGN